MSGPDKCDLIRENLEGAKKTRPGKNIGAPVRNTQNTALIKQRLSRTMPFSLLLPLISREVPATISSNYAKDRKGDIVG